MQRRVLFQVKSLDKEIYRILAGDETADCSKKPSPTQMSIIKYILDNPQKEIYQSELEEVLNLRRATVSGVLQTMESNGLITRVVDEKDTRTKKIILDEKTKEIFLKNKEKFDKLEKYARKGITKEELDTFFAVIEKINNNIKEYKE